MSNPLCQQFNNQGVSEEETSALQSVDLCDALEPTVGRELLGPEALSSRKIERRISEIQRLLAVRGTVRYGEVQRQVAQSLGITVRSVQCLMKSCHEQGLAGILKQSRKDRGTVKTDPDWHEFIVKTYREGNRASRQMSPAQVEVRVRVRAQELGVEDYPGRTTVYRILRPYIEKRQHQK